MEQKYFEDINVGYTEKTIGRTMNEAYITTFAGLSGDFNPIHMDDEFAKNTFFKQRVAHGFLVVSIASGLYTQSELNLTMNKNVMALLDIRWRMLKPVFIGDTIYLVVEIAEKKETSKTDRGIIITKRTVVNQRDETVHVGEVTLMLKRKPK